MRAVVKNTVSWGLCAVLLCGCHSAHRLSNKQLSDRYYHMSFFAKTPAQQIAYEQQALRLDPGNTIIKFVLAMNLKEQGRVQEAVPLFRDLAMGDNPAYARAGKRELRLCMGTHKPSALVTGRK